MKPPIFVLKFGRLYLNFGPTETPHQLWSHIGTCDCVNVLASGPHTAVSWATLVDDLVDELQHKDAIWVANNLPNVTTLGLDPVCAPYHVQRCTTRPT